MERKCLVGCSGAIHNKIYPLDIYPRRIYTRSMANNKANVPLTPAVLHILLALSTQERHGYGIMKQVESDSQGKVKMGPGTLYGSLGRMMEAGLIRESDIPINGSFLGMSHARRVVRTGACWLTQPGAPRCRRHVR